MFFHWLLIFLFLILYFCFKESSFIQLISNFNLLFNCAIINLHLKKKYYFKWMIFHSLLKFLFLILCFSFKENSFIQLISNFTLLFNCSIINPLLKKKCYFKWMIFHLLLKFQFLVLYFSFKDSSFIHLAFNFLFLFNWLEFNLLLNEQLFMVVFTIII
jgi:hypothetical protein